MIKILFICHGNICRSPMAEFVMEKIIKDNGAQDRFEVASAATSCEELGSPVYPPAKRKLQQNGIDCSGKTARHLNEEDYRRYDLIIGMDKANMRNMLRCFGGDPEGKLHNLLDYCGRAGEEVADPWYTGDFDRAYDDILQGCMALFSALIDERIRVDLSSAVTRADIYDELSRRLDWKDWYGRNLDALWDILTGMDISSAAYTFVLPAADSPVYEYAKKVTGLFEQSGRSVIIE